MTDVKKRLETIVSRFKTEESRFCAINGHYSEAETRTEFIDPLFSCLDWDMNNARGVPNSMKDVVREESQAAETSSKRPDYTFRIAAQRKFFVEAKKPSVDIRNHKGSAFQIRSYGWTAGLPISILTNFKTFRVYETRTVPKSDDHADVGLILEIHYSDLVGRFDELNELFGRESVGKGSIEEKYGKIGEAEIPMNVALLQRLDEWRLAIAGDLHQCYPQVGVDDLNDISQKVINRFIFVRMCEDRGIEGFERLKLVIKKKSTVELRKLFHELDLRYNTGLFASSRDPLQREYEINTEVLASLVEELYFPQTPYSFGVLDADFLGQAYELFLAKRMVFDKSGAVVLQEKENFEGREMVTTPQPLVDEIVRRTVGGWYARTLQRKEEPFDLNKLEKIRILDTSVGSGRFLLRCMDELVDVAIGICRSNNDNLSIYRKAENDYRLCFERKRSLLQHCLFGIDIDYNAVEVARFSLLVKLLEDETIATLPEGKKILPNLDEHIVCGNSVVGNDFRNIDPVIVETVNPMNWTRIGFEDPFDIIVGNPPYVKTENMKLTIPHEMAYYKTKFESAFKQFDKYFVFIESAVSKLAEGGWLGMVTPDKWMTIESGKKLRALLSKSRLVTELVDFGNELLFEGRSTYVCFLILSVEPKESFFYRRIDDYKEWLKKPSEKGWTLSYKLIDRYPGQSWVLPATTEEASLLTVLKSNTQRMAEVADVLNGIQTSADAVYAINDWTELDGLVRFEKEGNSWSIEKDILRPYLMDSTRIKSYCIVRADAMVIFPYVEGVNGDAVLIPPETLRRNYPLAWTYLNHYRERLTQRDVSPALAPEEFYRYGRHQALSSAFKAQKIIYSVNQLGDKYGLDTTGIGFASGGTAGEVSITNPKEGYTIEFLLALLHQRAVEYFLRKRGSPFRGGYYSRGSAVVSDCPVPAIDLRNRTHSLVVETVTELVREIISIQNELPRGVGRSSETMQRQLGELTAKVKAQFDLIWRFDGLDKRIMLPGEQRT